MRTRWPRRSARTTPSPPTAASPTEFAAVIGLIATLTLLLAAVAGLGVLNTVVLQTRERVHDLGVFKAVGMTPRQVTAMVVCSVAGIGLVAGLVAIPAGVALQRYVLPVMAHAAQTGVPASVLERLRPRRARPARAVRPGHRRGGGAGPGRLGGPRPHRLRPARRVGPAALSGRGGHPGRTGGPWLCSTLVLSLFHAVVVPSGFRTRVQPHRWITTW